MQTLINTVNALVPAFGSVLVLVLGGWAGYRWLSKSGSLPVQQNLIAELSQTLNTVKVRMEVLEKEAVEREAKHELALTELRGQMAAALMAKDVHIAKLTKDLAAQQVQIDGNEKEIVDLRAELAAAQASLAEYAKLVLRDGLDAPGTGRRKRTSAQRPPIYPLDAPPPPDDDAHDGGAS